MGLFSFLKNAGAKIFGTTTAAKKTSNTTNTTLAAEDVKRAEDIARRQKVIVLKGVVDSLNIDVGELDIDFYDDTVTIYGGVETQAEKEKVILALGNVAGVASVDDRMVVNTPSKQAIFYEVKRGDSLSKIAKSQYGNAMKYPLIFEANKPMLKDPNKIYPGQVLRIPEIDA